MGWLLLLMATVSPVARGQRTDVRVAVFLPVLMLGFAFWTIGLQDLARVVATVAAMLGGVAAMWVARQVSSSSSTRGVVTLLVACGVLALLWFNAVVVLAPWWTVDLGTDEAAADLFHRTVWWLAGGLAVWWFGTAIVRDVLEAVGSVVPRADDVTEPAIRDAELSRGRVIGVLERLLVYTLLLARADVVVAALLGFKAAMRYQSIEKDQDRAEYVLVGTLASLAVAVGAGLLIRLV